MGQIDWVIVPSIWWENSPVVIQEAYHYGHPVICSDIGGMKEKVIDGVTGIHFEAQNPQSLALILESIAEGEVRPEDFQNTLPRPISFREFADQNIEMYRGVGKAG
jgi:glycosyltransferase involved in cell wall biosynthesis